MSFPQCLPALASLFACRLGEWKAHFHMSNGYDQPKPDAHQLPWRVHLGRDRSEKPNVASHLPAVIALIESAVKTYPAGIVAVPPQLE